MKYLRSKRGAWAFALALFSIYLQIFLPLGLAVAAGRASDDGYSHRILICTAYGPKLIYDARGQEVPPEEGGLVECPSCIAHAIGDTAITASAVIVLPIPLATIQKNISVVYAVPDGFEASSAYLTRAPPESV